MVSKLEQLQRGTLVKGILPEEDVTIIDVNWHGSDVAEVTYKNSTGRLGSELLYRDNEASLEIVRGYKPWTYDADGSKFRLVSEALRIRLAYFFDPVLAVHTSMIDPLPHQITAVYEKMLPRQPLRFLLADDPGAGKTIMAGLFIKELFIRGDVKRCLVCCPGNLVEQWQDELYYRFHLHFDIITVDKIETSLSGNPYAEYNLVISRLDQMSRNPNIQAKLELTDWDLIVCDEAHKMSATFFGGEVNATKRYKLGKLLSPLTRNLLLLTATPHNGKDEDFQLFLQLLDEDRFEGRFRSGVHHVDTSDIMRRLVKEQLLKFDGTRLFPERFANTVTYKLSTGEFGEKRLYDRVTEYVREEMNRADRLAEGKRNVVGFALTVLQRRLASSPEAIYQSIRRRKERLAKRLQEMESASSSAQIDVQEGQIEMSEEDIQDLEDAPPEEQDEFQRSVVDRASAARTIHELAVEIETLKELEALSYKVKNSSVDRKWEELSKLLQNNTEMFDAQGYRRKLIIFTEYVDTLNYLFDKIRTLIGKPESIVVIHGSVGRDKRREAQEAFMQDKEVQFLVATDAAGEGINLQRGNLMVNYDLPWNPNRIEQRFGRIHRIGQTEVCHLWNLVAPETREGDVFHRLFEKLEEERKALGGQVFDVLGKVFEEHPLRDLLIQAIRYGDRPDVRAKLQEVVDSAIDRPHLLELLEERALARDTLSSSQVARVREEMERAEARKLQPHFISAFFIEALQLLGGTIREREPKRYELTHVPAIIRNKVRQIGNRAQVLSRYERITFEKGLINEEGKTTAEFVSPGHPLLNSVLDLIIERYQGLLKQGSVLIDPTDNGEDPRVLFYLESSVQDARMEDSGNRHVLSREMQFVEIDKSGKLLKAGYAPHLNYRPVAETELGEVRIALESEWLQTNLEQKALDFAVTQLVPQHFERVKKLKEDIVGKTRAAVQERLTKEIAYWDRRANDLSEQEKQGKTNAKMNSAKSRLRADELEARLQKRITELKQEEQLSRSPPLVIGGALVIPIGAVSNRREPEVSEFARNTKEIEMLAVEKVMMIERQLNRSPTDVSADKCGYDIESRIPNTGLLKFIEVKGRVEGAHVATITKNEILTALNKPDDFVLAIVSVKEGIAQTPRYVRKPFSKEPDFNVTSVNYNLDKLLEISEEPS
jgi:superfamily II DNA or RNA helicase